MQMSNFKFIYILGKKIKLPDLQDKINYLFRYTDPHNNQQTVLQKIRLED